MSTRRKILKYTAYTLFFLLCLFFFLVQGFPVAMIAQRLEQAAQAALGAQLKIDHLGTLFPNGVEAVDLRLSLENTERKQTYSIRVDRASMRISLLGLLLGRRSISFRADLLSGRTRGELVSSGGDWKLKGEVSELDLGRVPFWPELLGMQLAGKLSANADFQIAPKDIKQLQGNLMLHLQQGKLAGGKLYGVELPAIDTGKTEVQLEIQKGKADLKVASVKSEDVDASLEGYFLLQPRLKDITSHCRLRVKFSDAKLNELRSRIPSEFHGLLEGELNRARGADGHLRFSMFGRIFAGGMSFQPLRQ